MGNFRKNSKRAARATRPVDRAQNQLMKSMKKDIDNIKGAIETKYNIKRRQDAVNSFDGSTSGGRSDQILPVDIGVTQGLTDTMRVGDQVTLKHIDFKYKVNIPFTDTGTLGAEQLTTRVLLFWDSQPNYVTTAGLVSRNPVYWPGILQECVAGVTSDEVKIQVMLSQKSWDNRKRYQIIYDKTHTLSQGVQTVGLDSVGLGARSTTGVINFSKSYAGQKLRYTAGGTLPENRQLYLAYVSDTPTTATQPFTRPVINYNLRTLYDDI